MKKTAVLLLSALIVYLCCATVTASPAASGRSTAGMLSPALEVISYGSVMVKSGVVTGTISFSREDFERGIGASVDAVTFTSLPSAKEGRLMYNGSAVTVGQTISSSGLSEIKYVPAGTAVGSSFRFKTSGGYSIECMLRYTDTINLAPTAAKSGDALAVWTQTDIQVFGTLSGSDPEGDAIVFEIVKYPERGILKLTDASSGQYYYTPCTGECGKDEFTYVVRDEWGHYSEEATVVVEIDQAAADLCFADMDGHWAQNAAVIMLAEGAMDAETVDGKVLFEPDREITREEFIVTTMKFLGAGDIAPAATVFADGGLISPASSGYIARAYSLGIVNGIEKNGLLYFEPTSSVTRAEAAVILNSIIGAAEPDTIPVFADGDSVPAYARGSLYALTSEGIMSGTGNGNISPNGMLSRAQAAQILCKIKKMYS